MQAVEGPAEQQLSPLPGFLPPSGVVSLGDWAALESFPGASCALPHAAATGFGSYPCGIPAAPAARAACGLAAASFMALECEQTAQRPLRFALRGGAEGHIWGVHRAGRVASTAPDPATARRPCHPATALVLPVSIGCEWALREGWRRCGDSAVGAGGRVRSYARQVPRKETDTRRGEGLRRNSQVRRAEEPWAIVLLPPPPRPCGSAPPQRGAPSRLSLCGRSPDAARPLVAGLL